MAAVAHGREEEQASQSGGRRHLLRTGGWDLPPRRVLRNIFHGLRRRNPDFRGAKFVRTTPAGPAAGGGPAVVAEPQRVMPGLLLPEGRALDPAAARCFLSLADGHLHDIAFPHAGAGARCVGSSRGWVVMLKKGTRGVAAGAAGTETFHIAHPLLPAKEFRLPDEFSLFEAQVGAEEERFLVDRPRHLPETSAEMLQRVCKPEEAVMHKPYVGQVALSCSPAAGCVALCVYRWRHCLAVARPGDASWTRVDVGWEHMRPPPLVCFRKVVSVAHHGGSFYAACWDGTVLRVAVPPAAGSAAATAAAQRAERFAARPRRRDRQYLMDLRWWLAGGDAGGLVLIEMERYCGLFLTGGPRFHVYRWDGAAGPGRWRRLRTLDGRALFLCSSGGAFFADARTLPWCREDCVYFTTDEQVLRAGEDVAVECYEMRRRRTHAVANAGPKVGLALPVSVMP
ncbi:unnamed protein product [Urochloa decumbens]|uniref:KIB1-4 beta-propeller domain-containing protein n=1 Tax=Urochloa decumbens TaxID=240449 RepID=A0ABC9AH52_9POAL